MRTRPFLRTAEFLWQEGHTAHATKEEADSKTLEMLEIYRKLGEDMLSISLIKGVKTETEKFAGAEYTTTIEAMMQDGKALQSGTSHMLGQNFAKSFDVSFLDDKQQKQYVWQTSWGLSTRIIGALIMSHSDDKGLVLPPKIAPIQAVIIPIYSNLEDQKIVMGKVDEIKKLLDLNNIRYQIDDREGRPGFKYFEWERKGVPVRIEIGPKDVVKGSVVVVDRLGNDKKFVDENNLPDVLEDIFESLQSQLLIKSKKFREDNTIEFDSYSNFKDFFNSKIGFAYAHLCLNKDCENNIKEETGASTRCIPFEGGVNNHGNCIYCSKSAPNKVIFAKAY
jgi:prolyl-tRNA synthetase